MGSYELVTFEEVKSGNTFTAESASPELLRRIKDKEVKIVKIETILTPETVSGIEIQLLMLHDKGTKLPEELKPFVDEALRKRKELQEYTKSLQGPKVVLNP